MKSGFSDYLVYRDQKNAPSFSRPILVWTAGPISDPEKAKVNQILGSVDLDEDSFGYVHQPLDHFIQTLNTLSSEKVTHALIFTDIGTLPEMQRYQIKKVGQTALIISDSIDELMQDEQTGRKDRRKALWLALKAWK